MDLNFAIFNYFLSPFASISCLKVYDQLIFCGADKTIFVLESFFTSIYQIEMSKAVVCIFKTQFKDTMACGQVDGVVSFIQLIRNDRGAFKYQNVCNI